MQTISATELARQTRVILDTIISRGETVVVKRNQTMIAKIIPHERNMTASQALASFALPVLTKSQAQSWLQDSKTKFEEAVFDPWV